MPFWDQAYRLVVILVSPNELLHAQDVA